MNLEKIFVEPLAKLDPLDALKKAIRSNDDSIIKLNQDQLDFGRDAKGKSLGRYANFRYKGRFEPIDLKLKNDFRGDMYVKTDDKRTSLNSFDWKTRILIKRFGKDIFGVVPFRIPTMADIIKRDFVNNLRAQL